MFDVNGFKWVLLIGSIALLLSEVPARAQAPACPNTAVGLVLGDTRLCNCTGNAASSGNIYGTGIYTHDSAICRAAVHSGAIPAGGGDLQFTVVDGLSDYSSSENRGIQSYAYGPWSLSISFIKGSYSAVTVPQPVASQVQSCPIDARYVPDNSFLKCHCTASAAAYGAIWGSGTYTSDSNICRAAAHAGTITEWYGGDVCLQTVPGYESYSGVLSRGVMSESYGRWNRSFVIGYCP